MLIVALLFSTHGSLAAASDLTQRTNASRAAVQELQAALSKELRAAFESGGPAQGIEICSRRAMTISADISKKHGWDVGRTSLRVRNPANVPDAWEEKVLRDFEKRKAAGEDPARLEYAEIVNQSGKSTFRYMKAIVIPAGAPCLACHGRELDASVAGKLRERYPNDRATGFREGDLRGAFSVSQPL